MKHLWTFLLLLATQLSVSAATYYVDYLSGSDGYSGTSKSAPWKRAPGMKGFAGSYTHTAGDRFIFRGGVRWPVSCFQWKITVGGTSSVRDYYGSDPTWYAGGSFSKPLFDFERTLVGPGWVQAAGVLVDQCSYITFDGLEFANHRCPLAADGIGVWGASTICLSTCSEFILQNCVVRDWDMPTPILYGSSGGGGIVRVNTGSNNLVTRSVFHQQGSPVKNGSAIWNINEISYSEIHHTPTAVMSAQSVHHNYIHHLEDPTDDAAHSNVLLCLGGVRAYNNVIHDTSPTAQVIFVAPGYYGTPSQDWIYNNLVYNVAQPCVAIDTNGQNDPGSGSHVFNNTLVGSYGTGHCIRVGYRANGSFPLLECRNNHYITRSAPILMDNPDKGGAYVVSFVDSPRVAHTPDQALSYGYTLANEYQATDSGKPTVNTGMNLSGTFTTDVNGVLRGQLGAWDVGAYEFTGTSSGSPGTLSQDTGTRSVAETAGSITLTVHRIGGTSGAVSCSYSTANGTATAGVNYRAVSGTLSWASGDAGDKTISVPILNASMVGNKDFTVALSSPTGGATLGSPSSTVVTIVGSGTIGGGEPSVPGQIFTNGSFESGMTGWSASGNVFLYTSDGGSYTATDGANLLTFNIGQSTPDGSLSQSFGTVAGQSYSLTFDAGVLAFSRYEQRLLVTVRGAGTVLSKTVSMFGDGTGKSKWTTQSFTFVADGATSTLTFQDVSPTSNALDLLLDNVRVGGQSSSSVSITRQPVSTTASIGGTASFSVEATGSGTLSYQWRFGGAPISGATGSILTISNVQAANAGSYSVVVSNGSTSATSASATLTVSSSSTAGSFTNGSFESGYTGWSASGNQSLATGSEYKPTDGIQVVCFNSGQSTPNGVLSQTFATVAGQTYTLSFDVGARAYNRYEQRMQVTVSGNGSLLSKTVSVFGDGTGTAKWASQLLSFVADSSTSVLTFKDVSPTSNSLDMVLDNVRIGTSGSTSLSITQQPASLTVSPGGTASFSVTASGSGTLSYQWRFNGNSISGATGSAYTISNVQAANAGNYDVVVSNGSTSVTSARASLVVTSTASTFTNGSFESDYLGWTQSGYQRIAGTAPYPGSDGAKLVVFNAGDMPANGILSQTFATTAGRTYVLTCNLGVLSYVKTEQRLQITVQGNGTLLSQTASITGAGGGSTRWASKSYTFTADSATTTLTFRDVSPSTKSLDMLLDKVQVTAQ